jgi:uncharacterized protein YkwD
MSRRSSGALERPTFGVLLVAALATLAIALASPVAGATAAGGPPCGNSTASPGRSSLQSMGASELCLINLVRIHHHLVPLSFNSDLRESATGHSDSMVVNGYFAHEGPGGSVDSRISRAGYLFRAQFFTIGENIAAGAGRGGSPRAILLDWLRSPPHRANILDPGYRDAGVGVARGFPFGGGGGAATYTVDFGARRG